MSARGAVPAADVSTAAQPLIEMPSVVRNLAARQDPFTKLLVSHTGHPGYERLGFLDDQALAALFLRAVGEPARAEEILDYFAALLAVPAAGVMQYADVNDLCGVLKLVPAPNQEMPWRGFINAFDVQARAWCGAGQLDYDSTPGPQAFLALAMLQVNPERYRQAAVALGEALLLLQRRDGAIPDGDRNPENVYTEPHLDVYALFLSLAQLTKDKKWSQAAVRCYEWFSRTVLHAEEGVIDQGTHAGKPHRIFATDCYSWTMAGPAGDRLSPAVRVRLSERMLRSALVQISVPLPDHRTVTAVLADFSNPEDSRVQDVRQGFYPLGSVEWTGGVILALQKNAARFWSEGDHAAARRYKAIAELLLTETARCFFADGKGGLTSFYASGQGIAVGPFNAENTAAWRTPYFHCRRGTATQYGGSISSLWALFPLLRVNPLQPGDAYGRVYDQIPYADADQATAQEFLTRTTESRRQQESVPSFPESAADLEEPRYYNARMWRAWEQAEAAGAKKNKAARLAALEEVRFWAEASLAHPEWRQAARAENRLKQEKYGGIIYYPWGMSTPLNIHPLHAAIWSYPVLNEIGTVFWAAVTACEALGKIPAAVSWIEQLLDEAPLHQIAAVQGGVIVGYWNALDAWENNPAGEERNERIARLLADIKKRRAVTDVAPAVIELPEQPERNWLYAIVGGDTPLEGQMRGITRNMWQSLATAYALQQQQDVSSAREFFQQALAWAEKIAAHPAWPYFARCDNLRKEQDGGLIAPEQDAHDAGRQAAYERALNNYALLNETAAALWGMAVALAELEQPAAAEYWINRLIRELPLHQLSPRTVGLIDLIPAGSDLRSWNGLRWWEKYPRIFARSAELYRAVVR
ncbi:MAG: hypothetical protein NC924_01835 [Candidatus Omnitrophica bacterium]|nr:hypothetical protein [Candidatus Omnitrophota bacterium]